MLRFAYVNFKDSSHRPYLVRIRNIKNFAPRASDDFIETEAYQVKWEASDLGAGKSSDYYPAFIKCLGATQEEVMEKAKANKWKKPLLLLAEDGDDPATSASAAAESDKEATSSKQAVLAVSKKRMERVLDFVNKPESSAKVKEGKQESSSDKGRKSSESSSVKEKQEKQESSTAKGIKSRDSSSEKQRTSEREKQKDKRSKLAESCNEKSKNEKSKDQKKSESSSHKEKKPAEFCSKTSDDKKREISSDKKSKPAEFSNEKSKDKEISSDKWSKYAESSSKKPEVPSGMKRKSVLPDKKPKKKKAVSSDSSHDSSEEEFLPPEAIADLKSSNELSEKRLQAAYSKMEKMRRLISELQSNNGKGEEGDVAELESCSSEGKEGETAKWKPPSMESKPAGGSKEEIVGWSDSDDSGNSDAESTTDEDDIARAIADDIRGEKPLPTKVDEVSGLKKVKLGHGLWIPFTTWEKGLKSQAKDTLFCNDLPHALWGKSAMKLRSLTGAKTKQKATPKKTELCKAIFKGRLIARGITDPPTQDMLRQKVLIPHMRSAFYESGRVRPPKKTKGDHEETMKETTPQPEGTSGTDST